MGIVNVTPDSFSDGGRFVAPQQALEHARTLVSDGAHIIDIGGESTRPGATPVTAGEELQRVIPVIEALRAESPIAISIDTWRHEVARAAIAAGADVVNDVSGGAWDPAILDVVADTGAALVVCHCPADRASTHALRVYGDIASEVLAACLERARAAEQRGVASDRLWIDPGFGFGKEDAEQNLELFGALDRFVDTGIPVLVGVSRKRMIRALVGEDPVAIDAASAVAATVAARRGAAVLRVHDVRGTVIAYTTMRALGAPGWADHGRWSGRG